MQNPSKPRFRGALGVLGALAVVAAGCAAPRAQYQTRLPAQLDVGPIESVAVANFDGLQQTGTLVADKLAEGLVAAEHYLVLERRKFDLLLAEREFARAGHVDEATATSLRMLGADALIFGVVDVFSVDDQTGVTKVETKVASGEYEVVKEKGEDGKIREVKKEIMTTVLVDRGHVIRSGTMGVTFRLANVHTGRIVAIRSETSHFSERAWADERSKLTTKDAVLGELAFRVTQRFLQQIQPSDVVRTVAFEKNDDPNTDVGIKYAQAGLWDKAAGALRSAAVASPAVASAHYNLGLTYEALGRYDEAAATIERAIGIAPEDKYIRALAQVRRSADDAQSLEAQSRRY